MAEYRRAKGIVKAQTTSPAATASDDSVLAAFDIDITDLHHSESQVLDDPLAAAPPVSIPMDHILSNLNHQQHDCGMLDTIPELREALELQRLLISNQIIPPVGSIQVGVLQNLVGLLQQHNHFVGTQIQELRFPQGEPTDPRPNPTNIKMGIVDTNQVPDAFTSELSNWVDTIFLDIVPDSHTNPISSMPTFGHGSGSGYVLPCIELSTVEDISYGNLLFAEASSAEHESQDTGLIFGFSDEKIEGAFQASNAATQYTGCVLLAVMSSMSFSYRFVHILTDSDIWGEFDEQMITFIGLGVNGILIPVALGLMRGNIISCRQQLLVVAHIMVLTSLVMNTVTMIRIFHTDDTKDTIPEIHAGMLMGVQLALVPFYSLIMMRVHFVVCILIPFVFIAITVTSSIYPDARKPVLGLFTYLALCMMLYVMERSNRVNFISQLTNLRRDIKFNELASLASGHSSSSESHVLSPGAEADGKRVRRRPHSA